MGPINAVGVDIGGTKMLVVRLDAEGRLIDEQLSPAPRDGASLVARLVEVALGMDGGASSLGVGVPGVVDETGTLVFAPNLPGALGARIEGQLAAALPGAKVWVGNDANAAGWGEHSAGAGTGRRSMLMVTLGTGIGGAVIADGRLREGTHRFAGEFGHMVVDPNGILCPCGKRGCWERYASGAGLGMFGREVAAAGGAPVVTDLAGGDPEAVRGEHVTAAAGGGDPDAVEIMRRFGWWVALGVTNLIAAFDPDAVVIGGGLVAAGEVLMAPVRDALGGLLAGAAVRAEVPVLAATLGYRAGAVGAALLAAG